MAEGNKLPEPGLVEKKMDYVVGASLLVRSSYLQEVGLMAEDYFLYFEEIDWVTRGRGRCVLAYAPKSVVYHKIGASIGTATNPLRKSLQSDYYSLCNRLLFTRRFFPYALPGIYAGLAMELLVRMLLGRWRVAWMVSRAILSVVIGANYEHAPISVITVTRNAERFLPQCLASVAAQGDGLFEHLIVDGGSTDSTTDIIKAHADSSPRLRWISEPDRGIADAMNKGVALATGEIITHLNADDYYGTKDVLRTVQDCFSRNPAYRWMTAGFTFVTGEGTFIRDIRVRRYSFRRLVRGNILLHPSTFISRDLFNAVGGFNDSLLYCMDYDLFLRLGNVAPPLVVDKQLSCFRVHLGSRSITHSEQAYAEEFRVRMDFLRSRGRSSLYYYWDYQIKKHLNKLFYGRLLRADRTRQ